MINSNRTFTISVDLFTGLVCIWLSFWFQLQTLLNSMTQSVTVTITGFRSVSFCCCLFGNYIYIYILQFCFWLLRYFWISISFGGILLLLWLLFKWCLLVVCVCCCFWRCRCRWRDARDVWCPSPIWTPRAVINLVPISSFLFHFSDWSSCLFCLGIFLLLVHSPDFFPTE